MTPPVELPLAPRAWTGPGSPADGRYAYTDPGSLPSLWRTSGERLTLRHTEVHADVRGPVAEVRIRQTFHNPAERPVDVLYAFARPESAVVDALRLVIGERVVEGELGELPPPLDDRARARTRERLDALLEPAHPHVLTCSVDDVAPGRDIEVELRYTQPLAYDAGWYELVLPLVLGPHLEPDAPEPRDDVAPLPHAARITPPIAGHGTRSGLDLSLTVTVDAGEPVATWTAPTHDVEAETRDGRLHVTLAPAQRRPNRDFVLRHRVAGDEPRATAFLGPPDAHGLGHYLLVVHPPAADVDAEVGRRELVFVVDRSTSMKDERLALATRIVRKMVTRLRPVDAFEVVRFGTSVERLFGRPRPVSAESLASALRFIEEPREPSGTELEAAVDGALIDEAARGYSRTVIVLTDGYVEPWTGVAHVQTAVERAIEQGRRVRVFPIGIGASPHLALMEAMAKAGRGTARFVDEPEDVARVVDATLHDIDRAVLTELRLPADSPLAQESLPAVIPDLFISQPVVVVGRYRGELPQTAWLDARRDGAAVRVPVRMVSVGEDDELLARQWARAAAAELEAKLWHGHDAALVDRLVALGLRHHVVTARTSFVAVERGGATGDAPVGGSMIWMGDVRDLRPLEPARDPGETQRVGLDPAGRPIIVVSWRPTIRELHAVPPKPRSAPPYVHRDPGPFDRRVAHVRLERARSEVPRRAWPLRRALSMVTSALRSCYERSPLFDQAWSVALLVELRVDASGRATADLVRGRLQDEHADRCIEDVVARAPFTLEPGAVVQLPLVLWAGRSLGTDAATRQSLLLDR